MIQEKDLPAWVRLGVVPAVQILLAFAVASLLIFAIGQDPGKAIGLYFEKVLGTAAGWSTLLFYATTLIFTGLSVAMAFQAGMFNIGSEGQGVLGAIGITIFAVAVLGPMLVAPDYAGTQGMSPTTRDQIIGSNYLGQIVLFIAAGAFGMAWAFIPGFLQAYRGSHLVITTIMFNFIASALLLYLLSQNGPLVAPDSIGDPKSASFHPALWLDNIGGWFQAQIEVLKASGERPDRLMRTLAKSKVNSSLIVALLMAFLFWIFMWRTRWGFAVRAIGANPNASHYAGINVKATMVLAVCLSGMLAGLAATNILLGSSGSAGEHLMRDTGLNGLGFVGIAVALMGRNHPIGVVLSALLFGSLYAWGENLQGVAAQLIKLDIDREFIVAIQGLVILFTGALYYMVLQLVLRVIGLFWKPKPDAAQAAEA